MQRGPVLRKSVTGPFSSGGHFFQDSFMYSTDVCSLLDLVLSKGFPDFLRVLSLEGRGRPGSRL